METKTINELAELFTKRMQGYYIGDIPNVSHLSEMAEILAKNVLAPLERTDSGLITPLMRIVAHYAATSTDKDKASVIAKITDDGGVCPLLECVQATADIVGVWSNFLDTISVEFDELADVSAYPEDVSLLNCAVVPC